MHAYTRFWHFNISDISMLSVAICPLSTDDIVCIFYLYILWLQSVHVFYYRTLLFGEFKVDEAYYDYYTDEAECDAVDLPLKHSGCFCI